MQTPACHFLKQEAGWVGRGCLEHGQSKVPVKHQEEAQRTAGDAAPERSGWGATCPEVQSAAMKYAQPSYPLGIPDPE